MTLLVWTGLAFGATAWLGALFGRYVCIGQEPREDGPPPIAFPPFAAALVGALIGIGVAWHHPNPVQFALAELLVLVLAEVAVCSLALGIVPLIFTLVPLAVCIACAALRGDARPIIGAALVGLPFASAVVVSVGRGMRWGDVGLAAMAGAMLGAPMALGGFALATVAAFTASRSALYCGRPVALTPFIAGGIAVMLALVPTI